MDEKEALQLLIDICKNETVIHGSVFNNTFKDFLQIDTKKKRSLNGFCDNICGYMTTFDNKSRDYTYVYVIDINEHDKDSEGQTFKMDSHVMVTMVIKSKDNEILALNEEYSTGRTRPLQRRTKPAQLNAEED